MRRSPVRLLVRLGLSLAMVGVASCRPDAPLEKTRPDVQRAIEAEEAVRRVLERQVEAWNRGSLEGFMEGYWQSDSLRFASGGSVRRGWEEALEAYQRGYPDRPTMGLLTFDSLDVRVLSPRWATAFGRWRLDRDEPASGLFTLILERRTAGDSLAWRIVHDHTSSASVP